MRVKVTLEIVDGKNIYLPLHHNSTLQGLIYSIFSESLAQKLHEEGYVYGKRHFKLFHFSRIVEKGTIVSHDNKKYFMFGRSISFYMASPVNNLIEDFGEQSISRKEFSINGQNMILSRLEIVITPTINPIMKIKTLSPITMYSTNKNTSGKNIMHYYKPTDNEFSLLIEQNAKKKYELIHKKAPSDKALMIKPYTVDQKRNFNVIIMKGTPIECWTGIYTIYGDPELIEITYHAGLGCKNSIGLGMWDVY